MKKIVVSIIAAIVTISMTACGQSSSGTNESAASNTAVESSVDGSEPSESAENESLDGGWEKPASPELTKEAEAALEKAAEGTTEETYKPFALLGTQVVAGTNYSILCRITPADTENAETWGIVTVYEDLEGNAELTDVQYTGEPTNIAEDEEITGGWELAESPVITEEEQDIFEKGIYEISADYDPVAILSYQVVAGENYCFFAEVSGKEDYAFIYLYEDLEGNVELTDHIDFRSVDESDNGSEADGMLTGTIIEVPDGTSSLTLAADDIYMVSTESAEVIFKGQPGEVSALKPGMEIEIDFGGDVMESWPAQVIAHTISSEGYPENEEIHDLCGLYLKVLEDLWETDSGLNDDIDYISVDLSNAPGNLSDAEKEAIAWTFAGRHHAEMLTLSYDELLDGGYFKEEEGWNDGILFTVRSSDDSEDSIVFDAEKWRGPTGADFFEGCTVEVNDDGTWKDYEGSFAIS